MKKALFFLALLGWIASLTVHIASLTGHNVLQDFPFVMALHAGIFLVWIPTILYLKKDVDYIRLQQSGFTTRANPLNFFKVVFKNAPPLLKVLTIASFIYTPLNFIISMNAVSEDADPSRMFSGHWIAFYGISLSALYPFTRPAVL